MGAFRWGDFFYASDELGRNRAFRSLRFSAGCYAEERTGGSGTSVLRSCT